MPSCRPASTALSSASSSGTEAGEAGRKFINSLQLFYHVANIGDSRSLAIHPASTTHSQLNPEEQERTGVNDRYVRLSIGIEHIDDILADLGPGARCRLMTGRRFPATRCVATRRNDWNRLLVAENVLTPADLIWPAFAHDREDPEIEISSIARVCRYSVDSLVAAAGRAKQLGIPLIAVFPAIEPELKTG